MRTVHLCALCALIVALAGCASGRPDGPLVERGAPAYRVVCEVSKADRAHDSGEAVVTDQAVQKFEFTVSDRKQIRQRLQEYGVGTPERPCSRYDVQPLAY